MSPSPTILIVEDDPVFRRVMSFTVANFGLRVETAGNGQEGFDRVVAGGIDFLVTDLQMPVCTGLQLIEMLDEIDTVTRPPTILCTAKGLELDTVGLIRMKRLVAIMHKPFSPRKLGELIKRQLGILAHESAAISGVDLACDVPAKPDATHLAPTTLAPNSGTLGTSIDG